MAMLAPISAQPRAASMPMPLGPEAPVTTTTLPFRESWSRRDSCLVACWPGMLAVVVWLVMDWRREAAWVDVMAVLVERGYVKRRKK
jgi:hypothetical protein